MDSIVLQPGATQIRPVGDVGDGAGILIQVPDRFFRAVVDFELPPEEAKLIPEVCFSLEQAMESLDKDRDFLKAGGVFTDEVIDAYIGLKMQEVTKVRMSTHPLEFELYYSV